MNIEIKVIKIKKCNSATCKDIFIIVDKNSTLEEIEAQVEDTCHADTLGSSNGYSYSWEEELDQTIVFETLIREDKRLTTEYKKLRDRSIFLREQLIKLNC